MHKFYFTLIILSLNILSACDSSEPNWLKAEKQAAKDAEALGSDVALAYLQCYALDYKHKKECVQSLNNQYINANYKDDLQYQKSFQYKAEKLGFLQFLKDRNLPCSGIDYGPQFVIHANAYRVICNCEHHYLLNFDDLHQIWLLKY